jgi:hypothetical protein
MSNKKKPLNPVVKKIQKLIPDAPRKWATLVSEKTGFSYSYIIEIKAGKKGKDAAIVVLKALIDVVDKRKREIEKLTV